MARFIRTFHRWTSIAFVLGVIANFAALQWGEPPAWVYALAGVPLMLLVVTGLYLFVLPYTVRRGKTDGARG